MQTYFSVYSSIDPKRLDTTSNLPMAKSISLLSNSFSASDPCSDLILSDEFGDCFSKKFIRLGKINGATSSDMEIL